MGLSFRKKLFFSISILIMVLMLICTVIFSIYTYQNLYRQSLQTLRQINEHTSSELKNLFESMDQLSLYISTNLTVRTAFSDAIAEDYSNSDLNRDTVELLSSVSIPLPLPLPPYLSPSLSPTSVSHSTTERETSSPSVFPTAKPTRQKNYPQTLMQSGMILFRSPTMTIPSMESMRIIGVIPAICISLFFGKFGEKIPLPW